MLKPKKNNITKKEIQKDPLLETIDQFQAKVEKNKQLYGKLVVGALALIVFVSFLVRNNRLNNDEADTALGKAIISIDKRDFTTATFQLENILMIMNPRLVLIWLYFIWEKFITTIMIWKKLVNILVNT